MSRTKYELCNRTYIPILGARDPVQRRRKFLLEDNDENKVSRDDILGTQTESWIYRIP